MAQVKLSKEQAQSLRDAQKQLNSVLPDLDNLEYCGIDCQQARDHIAVINDRTSKVLQKFGPNMLTD